MSIAYAMVPASLLRAQRELAPTSLHTQATSLLGRGGVKEGLEPSDLSPPLLTACSKAACRTHHMEIRIG
jgi:hypothetical protein